MTKNIEWTDDFEQKLIAKIESEYQQADNMVVFASRCNKPLNKGGLIEVKNSAKSMVEWIKKELGV